MNTSEAKTSGPADRSKSEPVYLTPEQIIAQIPPGIHTTLNDPFDVRDTVRITDATAGARRPIYEGTDSDEHLKQRNWQPGFTLLHAAIVLVVVILALAAVYVYRSNEVARLAIEVSKMNDAINSLIAPVQANVEYYTKQIIEFNKEIRYHIVIDVGQRLELLRAFIKVIIQFECGIEKHNDQECKESCSQHI